MKIGDSTSSLFDLVGSRTGGGTARTQAKVPTTAEEGLELVEAAKESAHNTTMRTWDKHTDMVEKSQQLRQIRDRKEAIERQNEERRDEQTELMARVALENANRSKLLEAEALERQAKTRALAA
ncbi:MAG: hypothetical protein IJ702_09825 [Fretibacterium sp.]|nr:hypothetical protein [Fretibacterium sp.]